MNKSVVLLPLAFVLGGMVAYWNGADEVRQAKERAEAAEKRPASQKREADGFGSLSQLVQIPKEAKRPAKRERGPADPSAGAGEGAGRAEGEGKEAEAGRKQEDFNPADLRERIEEAADLWRTRIEVAKASAVEKLGLDEAGQERFEAALATMNERIRDSIQTIADALAAEEQMTPEINVRLMGDIATTIAEAYDGVGESVDESRRGEVSQMHLFEFIDPSVAEPLIAVQGKLGDFGSDAGGGKRR